MVASAAGGARNCSLVESGQNYNSSLAKADKGDTLQLVTILKFRTDIYFPAVPGSSGVDCANNESN